jgi:hypothetical protein
MLPAIRSELGEIPSSGKRSVYQPDGFAVAARDRDVNGT